MIHLGNCRLGRSSCPLSFLVEEVKECLSFFVMVLGQSGPNVYRQRGFYRRDYTLTHVWTSTDGSENGGKTDVR